MEKRRGVASVTERGGVGFPVDPSWAIGKRPPALVCPDGSRGGLLFWSLTLFSISFLAKYILLIVPFEQTGWVWENSSWYLWLPSWSHLAVADTREHFNMWLNPEVS